MKPSQAGKSNDEVAVRALAGVEWERPVPTAQRVADLLRQKISDGAMPPGSRLTEESLAGALKVSRNTVRESFALLAGEQIVDRFPSRGVFVATPDADDVRDLYQARMLVEAAALQWGQAPEQTDFDRLAECIATAREAALCANWDGVALANQGWHRAIASLSRSERTATWSMSLLAQLRLVFHRIEDKSFHAKYIDDNEAVLRHLQSGDRSGATTALMDYLSRARDDVLSRLPSPES